MDISFGLFVEDSIGFSSMKMTTCFLSSLVQWLFGDYARVGKEECWDKNSDGNWQGNCGSIKNDDGTYTYIPCKDR